MLEAPFDVKSQRILDAGFGRRTDPAEIRGREPGLFFEDTVEGTVVLEPDCFGDFKGFLIGGQQQQLGPFYPQSGQILDKTLAYGFLEHTAEIRDAVIDRGGPSPGRAGRRRLCIWRCGQGWALGDMPIPMRLA